MALFFTNPILRKIEDIAWDIAKEELKNRLGDDVDSESPQFLAEQKKIFQSFFSEERKKAKMALKLYKKLAPEKTRQALIGTISTSAKDWFSIERAWNTGIPEVLAVPKSILSGHVAAVLDLLLSERIEFKNLHNRARQAFVVEAIDKFVDAVLKQLIRQKTQIKAESFYPYDLVISDVIEDDYYLLGEDKSVSRESMVIVTTTALKSTWKDVKSDIDARPQDRRFTNDAKSKWASFPRN